MKKFREFNGVDDFIDAYHAHEKKFVTDSAVFAEGWKSYTEKFLKANLTKTKFTQRLKIATIEHGMSFENIEEFIDSISTSFKVDEVVYDAVRGSFTFYGSKK